MRNRFAQGAGVPPAALALILSLSACSLLPERPTPPALHDFGPAAAPEAAPWSAVTVDAPEWLQSENLRYRLLYAEPTRVRAYSQDRWLAPPPALLAQRLSLSQGQSGPRLKIKLLEFEQVFDGPQSARTILAFRATATQPDNDGVVGEKLFQFTQAAPGADARGAVAGFSKLVGEAADSLRDWLRETATRRQ